MTFPLNPANNSETIVDGITYRYSSTDNAWTRIAQPLAGTTSTFRIENTTTAFNTQSGALQVVGGVGIQGDLFVGGVLNAPSLQRGGQDIGFGYSGSLGFTGSQGFAGSAGFDGSVGFTGSRGETGFTGSQGNAGAQGNAGFAGSLGFSGSQGFTGSAGFFGSAGFTGSQGFTGFTGSRGCAGTQGNTGFTGSVGFTGSQGFAGSAGFFGSTGFVGSQGVSGFTGSQGDPGESVRIIGSTSTATTIAFNSINPVPTKGDGVIVTFNGRLWVYTVSGPVGGYTDVGAIVGPQGCRGFSGSSGFAGSGGGLGFTGSRGFDGSQGVTGFVGSQGFVGFTGSRGEAGTAGNTGFAGSAGNNGFAGSRGFDGSQGVTGFVGSQGFVGFTGSQGNAGTAGATGFTGSASTVPGFTGSQGVGFTGSAGAPGAAGIIASSTTSTFTILNNTNSTSTTTGALVVQGGVGIGRDVVIGGNVVGGSIRTTSSATPPANPTVGDVWYNTTTDDLYRFTTDGATSYWLDIIGPSVANSLGTAVTQPAFHAFATAGQSLGAFSTSKVVMQNVLYDNTDSFNNTAATVVKNGLSVPSYSFMPTVAGYYQINYAVRQSSASSEIVAQIAKNNSTFALATDPTSNVLSSAGSALVYLNGTTDFVHVMVFVAAAVSVASRTTVIDGATIGFDTYFSGIYVGNGVVSNIPSSPTGAGSMLQSPSVTPRTATGANVDFTNIPSWVRRITLGFSGLSVNNTTGMIVRLSTGGVFATSGYSATSDAMGSAVAPNLRTDAFPVGDTTLNAADLHYGTLTLITIGNNIWIGTVSGGGTNPVVLTGGGTITLSGVLDGVRLTTVGGGGTFDAGTVNILYE
jgi:hypothetical protein